MVKSGAKNKKANSRVIGTSRKRPTQELDGVYVLKIVLYLVVGSQWLYLNAEGGAAQVPLPLGLIIGGFFASHDHFQIDRKIEFAILLIACLIGFWTQTGLVVGY